MKCERCNRDIQSNEETFEVIVEKRKRSVCAVCIMAFVGLHREAVNEWWRG